MYERVNISPEDESLDDFLDNINSDTPWWKEKIYYPVYRFFVYKINPTIWWYKTKWFIQRGRRGYADCDVWILSDYLAKVTADSLRQLAAISHGWPGEASDWPTFEGWADELRSVAEGLDHYIAGLHAKETCTCCGEYCNDTDCPIVIRAFSELFELWPGLWD